MFRHGEVVECRDIWPPHYRYAATWDEESETIGLLTWLDRRLMCLCSEGRQTYEDRIDGAEAVPCIHERLYLAFTNPEPQEHTHFGPRKAQAPSTALFD